jgi:hypothetical protein
MAEKRKYHTPQDLIEHLKSISQAQFDGVAARAASAKEGLHVAQRALQVAHCEDFFSKLEVLLPTHEHSRREAFQLLARLCSGRPNLPADMC